MSAPNLQNLSQQSRQGSSLYGQSGLSSNPIGSASLNTGRSNQYSTGLTSNLNSNPSLSLSNSRTGLNQSSQQNGFLGHQQSNQMSNMNSPKYSSGVGNSLSSNFGNGLSSSFGSSVMNSGIFGNGATSPLSSVPSSAGTFGSSVNSSTQGSSHAFGSLLNNNSSNSFNQFGLGGNTSYSSFNSFSSGIDMQNSVTESLDLSEFPSLQPPSKQMSALRLTENNIQQQLSAAVPPPPPNNIQNTSTSNLSNLVNLGAGSPFNKTVTTSKTYSEVSNTNISGQSKQEHSPGFQMSNEDFPALPGAPKNNSMMSQAVSMSNDIMSHISPEPQVKVGVAPVGTKPTKASIVLPSLPPSMCRDQFGMAGLLACIRSKDINLIKLTLGMDLWDLGLNLNSKGSLHNTFQSPWADRPCDLHHLEHPVPPEYLTYRLHDRLDQQRIKQWGDDLLFWLYYNNIGEYPQLMAIYELQNRGWSYYTVDKVWITKAPGREAPKRTYERTTYCHYQWFDVANWKRSEKEGHLEMDKLEILDQMKSPFQL